MRRYVIAVIVSALWVAASRAEMLPPAEKRAGEFLELTEAAKAGNRRLVEDLLRRGVDPKHPAESGETDAQYFASMRDPVQSAAMGGHAGVIEILLEAGATPDWQCCSGETALVLAAERGHAEAVRALLAGGAKPLLMGDHGPPLVVALAERRFSTAAILLLPTLFTFPVSVLCALVGLIAATLLWRLFRRRGAA
ncbi:MAG: ankyrin repeat domain-containing protein [Acidobacteriota bacterium]